MEPQVLERLAHLEERTEQIYKSIKRIQFYFMLTAIITVAAIVLPLIGLAVAIPHYINTLSSTESF